MWSFFRKKSVHEDRIIRQTVEALRAAGIPPKTAELTATQLMGQAVSLSKKDGTIDLPTHFGEIILGMTEATDSFTKDLANKLRSTLSWKRQEGVKDKDICWWWSLTDVERRMAYLIDDVFRMAVFKDGLKRGQSPEAAGTLVKKSFPRYSPFEHKPEEGDDKTLPDELRNRVEIFQMSQQLKNLKEYKQRTDSYTSLNAFFREEIRKGNL